MTLWFLSCSLLASGLSAWLALQDARQDIQVLAEFANKRLTGLIDEAKDINQHMLTNSADDDCHQLMQLAAFKEYIRGSLLLKGDTFYCSSKLGRISEHREKVLPHWNLSDEAVFVVPGTPAVPATPAIVVVGRDNSRDCTVVSVVDAQLMLDGFQTPLELPIANIQLFDNNLQNIKPGLEVYHSSHPGIRLLLKSNPDYAKKNFWHYLILLLPACLLLCLGSWQWWRKYRLRRSSMVDDIRRGLTADEFYLAYQPVLTTRGEVAGVETLLRWRHPHLGAVRPDIFIPLAEEHGLMPALTERVFSLAMADFAGLHFPDGFKLGVNLTAVQLAQGGGNNFAELHRCLSAAGVQTLLEITERTLIAPDITSQIEVFRRQGVLIAIDDFGTGQTSLALLQTLPLDYLKIDKCFVDTIGRDDMSTHVLDSIIALSHKLEYLIVAEGVETQAQAEYLSAAGVHFLQGFLFARPMPITELSPWLNAH
ncbi:EAL domain-containing protein, partial [Shewanella sp.]|uniref:EAL domain-containing protein n=1 Tax=Shewanella sp. TaxID=50422 RepID=UPI00356574EF